MNLIKYLLLKKKEPVIAVVRKNCKFLSFLKNIKKINKNLLIEEVKKVKILSKSQILNTTISITMTY